MNTAKKPMLFFLFFLSLVAPLFAHAQTSYWKKLSELNEQQKWADFREALSQADSSQIVDWKYLCYTTLAFYGTCSLNEGKVTQSACQTMMNKKENAVGKKDKKFFQDNFKSLSESTACKLKSLPNKTGSSWVIIVLTNSREKIEIPLDEFLSVRSDLTKFLSQKGISSTDTIQSAGLKVDGKFTPLKSTNPDDFFQEIKEMEKKGLLPKK